MAARVMFYPSEQADHTERVTLMRNEMTRREQRIARQAAQAEREFLMEQARREREALAEFGFFGTRRDVWSGQYETDKAWRDTDY